MGPQRRSLDGEQAVEARSSTYRIAALLLVLRIHLRDRVFLHPILHYQMSGFRGTFGNPTNDKVVAFIYDRVELLSKSHRKRVMKVIQRMLSDRSNLPTIPDPQFRTRAAQVLKANALDDISNNILIMLSERPSDSITEELRYIKNVQGLQTRLESLAKRYYRLKEKADETTQQ